MSDATPLNTQAERLAAAQAKQAAREQGIRANAFKEGRIAERVEIHAQLGVQAIEDASQVATIRAERDARPTPEEMRHHGKHRWWKGAGIGGVVGIMLGVVLCYVVLPVITTAMSGMIHEAVMTGALVGAHDAPQQAPQYPRQ